MVEDNRVLANNAPDSLPKVVLKEPIARLKLLEMRLKGMSPASEADQGSNQFACEYSTPTCLSGIDNSTGAMPKCDDGLIDDFTSSDFVVPASPEKLSKSEFSVESKRSPEPLSRKRKFPPNEADQKQIIPDISISFGSHIVEEYNESSVKPKSFLTPGRVDSRLDNSRISSGTPPESSRLSSDSPGNRGSPGPSSDSTEKRRQSNSPSCPGSSQRPLRNQMKIDQFFPRTTKSEIAAVTYAEAQDGNNTSKQSEIPVQSAGSTNEMPPKLHSSNQSSSGLARFVQMAPSDHSREPIPSFSETNSKLMRLQQELENIKSEHAISKNLLDMKSNEVTELKSRLSQLSKETTEYKERVAVVVEEMLRETDYELRRYERKQVIDDSFRLGRIITQSHGIRTVEIWQDGDALMQLRKQQLELLQRREDVEKEKKKTSAKMNKLKRAGSTSNVELNELEAFENEEVLRAELLYIKRREQELADEKNRLEIEKTMQTMKMRRLQESENSRFNKQPLLKSRYLLREMLGKGGFSEVWRAFDVSELRDVAVKVHEMNSSWSEQKKESYLKYATREYRIHLNLNHPRIVQLYDVFEIDANSFATVIEYCSGHDLDLHLKIHKVLPEREARSILIQILAGLRYLNSGVEFDEGADAIRPRIIHYDLKPGNILFDRVGNVKITDFGLSKIVDSVDAGATGIELTSQGAGTYWYLPPECFRLDGAPPKISSKVDVWSTGVIFYQMVFGIRPFGQGLTQERVLADRTMLDAREVPFPTKPAISNEAKMFIQRCLTYSQHERPDVFQISQDPYLLMKKI